MDLSENFDLGVENNIKVTPTILMFKPDGSVEEYLGLREQRPIQNYCFRVIDLMDISEAKSAPLMPAQDPDW